ncbi:MAG: SH3 domain-containing protein, partial [Eubacteriales bacterium]|nr:SH3 domain-containing protein [Eubacteriales bacterium]
MSDKRKLSSILGICGATVLAAGGSAFLTDTGLSLMDRGQQIELETETDVSEQETELPISVEQFTKSKDSFVVSVKRDTPAGGTASDAENANLMYATGDVNMRSSAGTDGDVLDTLPSGAEVTATGNTQGGWTEVTYNGQTGYVSSNYLAQGSTSGSNAGNGSGSTSGGSTGSGSGS